MYVVNAAISENIQKHARLSVPAYPGSRSSKERPYCSACRTSGFGTLWITLKLFDSATDGLVTRFIAAAMGFSVQDGVQSRLSGAINPDSAAASFRVGAEYNKSAIPQGGPSSCSSGTRMGSPRANSRHSPSLNICSGRKSDL